MEIIEYEGRRREFLVGNSGKCMGEEEFFEYFEGNFFGKGVRVVFYNTPNREMERIRRLIIGSGELEK